MIKAIKYSNNKCKFLLQQIHKQVFTTKISSAKAVIKTGNGKQHMTHYEVHYKAAIHP